MTQQILHNKETHVTQDGVLLCSAQLSGLLNYCTLLPSSLHPAFTNAHTYVLCHIWD